MTVELDGATVRAFRRSCGMTQAQLGDAVGLSRVTIGLIERSEGSIEKRTGLAIMYVTRDTNGIRAENVRLRQRIAELERMMEVGARRLQGNPL